MQPVGGIGGGWRLWEGYLEIIKSIMMLQKTSSETHVNVECDGKNAKVGLLL